MKHQQGVEWVLVAWYYATQVVAPIVLFVLVVLVAVKYLRGGNRRENAPLPVAATAPVQSSPVEQDAERAALRRELERARLETDLADAGLTRRERAVLLATCDGRTLASLADDWDVSRSTVGTYSARAYEKIGVSTREEARAWLRRRTVAHRLADKGLTEAEVETALLAVDGMATSEIASRLVLSESAINSRLQQIYNKFGVHSRAELVKLADPR